MYEFEISSFIIHSIKKDYLFVDVGANLGSHSVLASSVARCNSIAFEPNKEALKKFERQLQINNIEKFVQIKKIAIGNKKGEVLFTNNRDALNRVAINGKDNSYEQVQVSTLDLEIESNKKIVLKIDVEGFEMNVLKGANNLLSSDKLLAIIVEINGFNRNYGIHEKDIHNLILSYNFHPYHYIPLERKLIKMNLELLKKNYHPKDYIYIKNIDEISFNCAKARKRVLHTAKGFLI